ncbi:MAG: hypothetical protein JWP91_777 [Fibrobacteres bacterium]|nr:hypothetical protein [Fibrobacterota bacterium]
MSQSGTSDIERAFYHMKALSELMPRVLPKLQKLIEVNRIFDTSYTPIKPQVDFLSAIAANPCIDGVMLIENEPPTTDRGRIYWLLWVKKNKPMTPKDFAEEFAKKGWVKKDDLRFKKRLENKISHLKNRTQTIDRVGVEGYSIRREVWDDIKAGASG